MIDREQYVIIPPLGPEFEGAEAHRAIEDYLSKSHPEFDFVVTLDSDERQDEFLVQPPQDESKEDVFAVVHDLIFVASCILKGEFERLAVRVGQPKKRTLH